MERTYQIRAATFLTLIRCFVLVFPFTSQVRLKTCHSFFHPSSGKKPFLLQTNNKLLFFKRHALARLYLSIESTNSGAGIPSVKNDTLHPSMLHDNVNGRANPQQTPHSGRHFLPSHPSFHLNNKSRFKSFILKIINPIRRPSRRSMKKRFFEGWYYRITLPDKNVSFAFIFSIEDPGRKDQDSCSLAAVQVMGPDGYLIQADKDDSKFWAWEQTQSFGCTMDWKENQVVEGSKLLTTVMHPNDWKRCVKSGFQILPTRLLGRVVDHDDSNSLSYGLPALCDFDFTIKPLSGWGDDDKCSSSQPQNGANGIDTRKWRKYGRQKSTAGWLASYAVFEPHWQVTMADGRATGTVTWKGEAYNFQNVPFYAEKNWGGAFPSKWYWVQCNSFDGYCTDDGLTRLSVTAGGGRRKIPFGQTEDLGMLSVHYDGVFYEAVPWTGEMKWEVRWGCWYFVARSTAGDRNFEVELKAECDPKTPGTVIRGPTEEGLKYICRDSFDGNATLCLYELMWDEGKKDYVRKKKPPLIDNARSKHCAVEIGGEDAVTDSVFDWKGSSKMKQPMKGLVKLPYLLSRRKTP